ncbi:MAG: polyamine aminopropyltransferase [Nannocystaceae bacterium]
MTDAPSPPTGTPLAGRRHAGRVLAFSMFIMGACGLVYEYTLAALGNNLLGSRHEQIFVVIGVMMFAMGVGSVVQKQIGGHLVDKWLLFEVLLGLAGGLSTCLIYAAFAYTTSHQLAMYSCAFSIGVLIGMEIPLLIRINEQYSESLRANLSQVLFMDYVGSLVGALLFAYVLLTRLTLINISLCLGMVNTLLALLGVVYFWPLVRWRRRLVAAIVLTATVLGFGLALSGTIVATLEQRCFADPIVLSETTRYQHLVLTRRDDDVSLYIDGDLQFSSDDEAIYHEFLVHAPMSVAHSRRRVLILGGGDGLALREVLKYDDVEEVVLVDIDRRITELAREEPDLVALNRGSLLDARVSTFVGEGSSPGELREIRRSARSPQDLLGGEDDALAQVRVLNVDADLFLRRVSGEFDVVVIDFPDPKSIAVAKLYSVDFFRQLAVRLGPQGILSIQASSPVRAREVFLCVGATLRAAGFSARPYHHNVPSFGEWGWYLAQPNERRETEVNQKIDALERITVHTEFLTAALLRGSFAFGKRWLLADNIRPNTKMRPRLVEYARRAWQPN